MVFVCPDLRGTGYDYDHEQLVRRDSVDAAVDNRVE